MKYIFLAVALAVVGAVQVFADGATALPTLEQFKAELTPYEYKCDVQKYFAGNDLAYLFFIDQIPTNEAFNARLATIIPELFYNSLQKMYVLNPALTLDVYQNMKHEPMRFVCSHSTTKWVAGAIASARKRYFVAGEKTIDLGAFIAPLATDSESDIVMFNRAIFHESLHQLILHKKMLDHDKNAVHEGGKNDVVYSCSNFAWRPDPPSLDEIVVTDLSRVREQVKPYSPTSPLVDAYLDIMSTPHQLSKMKKERLKYPEYALLHVFSYDQCMTCALAEVVQNKIRRSTNAQTIARAEQICLQTAPKVKINLSISQKVDDTSSPTLLNNRSHPSGV